MDNQQKRSIQDIIPPARSKPMSRPMVPPSQQPPLSPPPTQPPIPPTPPKPLNMHPDRPKGGAKIFIIILVILVIAGAVFGVISAFFHRAYVTVTPHTFAATVEGTFESLEQDPLMPYSIISVQDTATKTVPATGSEEVENRASGAITVYNAFSTNSERLITNTRFQTADGLVFRVHTPLTISGYTMKAGVKVPGSVDVTVYADEAGERYNIGLVDFAVPGLKGSQQYELIYAKSKTPMSGGFVGEMAVVAEDVRNAAVDELKIALDRSLREKVQTNATEGSLVFADTVSVTYGEGTDTLSEGNAVISVSGTATAPAFPEAAFARKLAELSGIVADSLLSIENPNALSVHVNSTDVLGSETPLSVTVAGQTNLIATFNAADLARDLAGKNKTEVNTILPMYTGIADIVVKIYPFWRSSIPTDSDHVTIENPSEPAGNGG